MTKRNRLIASVLALTVVFVMLFSVCFIIAEADHDCVGEDCPICYQINICENTLRSIGFVSVVVIFAGFLDLFAIATPTLSKKQAYNTSLVSLKVKLSN